MTELVIVDSDGIVTAHDVSDLGTVEVYCECRDEITPNCDGDNGFCECPCHRSI